MTIRNMMRMEADDGATGGGEAVAEPIIVDAPSTSTETPTVDWSSHVPVELKDKPYIQELLKNENPGQELFKQFDGLQTKIGQRPGGVPADDASEEDWNAFFEAARPKESGDYALTPVDLGEDNKEMSDFMNSFRDDEFMGQVKSFAHKWGIPKKSFEGFVKDYEGLTVGKAQEQFDAQKALDAGFDGVFQEHFGGDSQKAQEHGRAFIAEHVPDSLKGGVSGLPNEFLAIMAGVAKSVHSKYDVEDTLPSSGAGTAKADYLSAKARFAEIMSKPETTNSMHPAYENNKEELKALSKIMLQTQNNG